MRAQISAVKPRSIACAMGIKSGDILQKINGEECKDLIALSYALAEEFITLEIIPSSGELKTINLEKNYDEDLGLEFESAVFDGVIPCNNNCQFCFVNQMPKGMRDTLYVKDDDFRLSFLYGNFITLTNLSAEDEARIFNEHLSPLYISIHATDEQVRTNLINNNKAGTVINLLQKFAEHNIKVHTQVVLCPKINDGKVLEKTFQDLLAMSGNIESLAVVPVGLTKFRVGLPELRTFTADESYAIIQQVEQWQKIARDKINKSFIYLGDEFYINAHCTVPVCEFYDGFPQLENGIGLVRTFLDEWEKYNTATPRKDLASIRQKKYLIITGKSAQQILAPLIKSFNQEYNTQHQVLAVENNFFGDMITVTGLLVATDILQAIESYPQDYDELILPAVTLRKGENIFLDDMNLLEFQGVLNKPVQIVHNALDLKKILITDS